MKNMMTKSTLREIKGSFSRWLAILAIVMLGVGFFCGLKVCQDAFTLTGDTYLNEHNLFDYELVSTMGLDEESVDTISAVDGVRHVEGSRSVDVLFEEEGTETARGWQSSTQSAKRSAPFPWLKAACPRALTNALWMHCILAPTT